MQLTQKEKTCHCCGKRGHVAPDCPERETKPGNEWFMCKAVSAYQNNENEEEKTNEKKETENDRRVKWSATTQQQFCQKIEPEETMPKHGQMRMEQLFSALQIWPINAM